MNIPNDQRTIVAPAPALHATVITLNNTDRLSVGETLLIRPAGPHLSAVTSGLSVPEQTR